MSTTATHTNSTQLFTSFKMASNLLTVIENETIKTKVIQTEKFGSVHVHIQGDLDEKKAVFLTVHDIGANHNSMKDFVDNDAMTEIRSRSCFIHVDVIGQEDNAQEITQFEFPSIQQIGEEVLLQVLDALSVPLVVGLGEGAGANILARFALAHQQRCLGLILIHLVSSGVGFLDHLKEKIFSVNKRRNSTTMSSLEIVQIHKMGKEFNSDETSKQLIENYKQRVSTINAKNLQKYVSSYMNRKEISDLKSLDVLLVAGGKSLFCAGVESIYSKCNKTKTSLLKVDQIFDIISECPEKLAQSLLLFVKGLGFLTSLQLPGIQAGGPGSAAGVGSVESGVQAMKSSLGLIGRRRTLSMEEYDIPRIRRLSLTK